MDSTTSDPAAPAPPPGLLRAAVATARDALELALPITCAGCGRAGVRVCPGCAVAWSRPPQRCETGAARWDWLEPDGPPPVWALAVNEGPVRRMVVRWKDGGRTDLTGWFCAAAGRGARWLAVTERSGSAVSLHHPAPLHLPVPSPLPVPSHLPVPSPWTARAGPPLLVVPAPASPAGLRRRGEDLVAQLARAVAEGLTAGGVPAVSRPVLRLTGGGDQTRLGARARAANRAGRVRVRRLPGVLGPFDTLDRFGRFGPRGFVVPRLGDPAPSGRQDPLQPDRRGSSPSGRPGPFQPGRWAPSPPGRRGQPQPGRWGPLPPDRRSLLPSGPRGPVPPGTRVLLVDDVLTTGATFAECRRALQGCGARVTGGLVLAVTRLPDAGVRRLESRADQG